MVRHLRLHQITFLLAGSMVACAASAQNGEMKRLADVVGRLERRIQSQGARIEELSNEVFVLSDRVDSARVEMNRAKNPPTLEVVKLVPDAAPPANSESTTDAAPVTDAMPSADDGSTAVIGLVDGEPVVLPAAKVRPPPAKPNARHRGAERSFRDALAAYRQGQVEIAYKRFGHFLRDFSGHAYADNARYWMGECRFDAHEYRQSIQQFAMVLKRYPRSNKIPDTLLKIGLAYERLGQKDKAARAFRDLVAGYPRSAMADLARNHLTPPAVSGGMR